MRKVNCRLPIADSRFALQSAIGNRKSAILTFIFVLLCTPATAIEDSEDTMNIESVTILAASSLTVPVTEIAKLYSRDSRIDVNTVYEDSDELLTKIEEGDPADIIITPSKRLFEKMKAEGLLDNKSIKTIAANSLSIVASREMKLEKSPDIKNILQQIHNKQLLIIGDPSSTSLGEASRESLKKLGVWPEFENRSVLAPTSSKTVDLIIKGQSAGIIYATDAQLYADKINNLGAIPGSMHQPITYYAAIVVGDNMERAREALKFFDSTAAKNILKADGFLQK